MRRFLCWFIIFIALISLFPTQVLAEEAVPAEQESTPKQVEAAPPIMPITPAVEQAPASPPSPVPPITTTTNLAVTTPETTPGAIVTTLNVSSTVEYIELLNQSDAPVDVSQFHLIASSAGQSCSISPAEAGWLLPDEYVTFHSPSGRSGSSHLLGGDCTFGASITRVEIYYQGSRVQLIDGITNGNWLRHAGTVKTNTKTTLDCTHKLAPASMKQTGTVNDYVKCSGSADLIEGTLYVPPPSSSLKIMEILPNSRACPPSDTSPDCSDYIKVKNVSNGPVNLANYRVRSGAKYSGATVSSSFNWQQPTLNPDRDELLLPGNQYFLLKLRNDGQVLGLSAGDGNVWIEDYYGTKTYDEASYADMDLAAANGRSWAYDEPAGAWRLGVPSPYGDNNFPEAEPGKGNVTVSSGLKPCRDDQYRSEETNRCRNITTASTPAPCKEGQYRSEETKRCRSIASAAAAVLKPCADDQFRSPTTNRCRKIASSDDSMLTDCGEGRERNPETHRCRNVKNGKVPDAAFAVEPLKQAGKAFIGWWALGGIGILALGYGAWEWRSEMGAGIRKVKTVLFAKGKNT